MYCIMTGHDYTNEIQSISQIFFPNEKFTVISQPSGNGVTVSSELTGNCVKTEIYENGLLAGENILPLSGINLSQKDARNAVQRGLFYACMSFAPATAPWGLLVGIRPTKIVHEMWDAGASNSDILRLLMEYYLVSEAKAGFCLGVAKAERKFLALNTDNSVSLYIGVPFCVSRCSYCSFSSYLMSRYEKQADAYVNALIKELDAVKPYIDGKDLQTIYIGGGTPTSLSKPRFEALLSAVSARFNVKGTLEYTVEAGRPDTIDEEKLKIMKTYGVGRVSVNPQTLNEKTLELIGRSHNVEDFYSAYRLASDIIGTVNVDLIAGLPGETPLDVKRTLEKIIELSPDNLTVHTLSVKRASMLKERLSEADLTKASEIDEMLEYSRVYAEKTGLYPYYMYRQKNTLGNFENVGYCKEGKEGIYNIQMIEEKQTVVAVGAGAATKHVDRKRNLVRRIYNVKTPEEYITRIDEMTERKKKLYEFDNERA